MSSRKQQRVISVLILAISATITACQRTSSDSFRSADEHQRIDLAKVMAVDLHGRRATLIDDTARGVLLVFVLSDCPISNAYAPRIRQVCQTYSPRGIRCFVVYVDPSVPDEELIDHAQEYGLDMPLLRDRSRELVRLVGAKVAPQAVLVDRRGQIVYSGRVDDQYVELGMKRRRPTTHDLINALDAFLVGKPATPSETQPVGCYIDDR
jgi:thioredoxin-related protein